MKGFLRSFLSAAAGTFAGVLLVVVGIPLLLVLIASNVQWTAKVSVEPQSVLHILLDGQVVDGAPSVEWIFEDGGHRIRLSKLIRAIRAAKEDSRIVGAVLDIRNPNMGWASATAIRRELESFKESKKFLMSYADRLDEKGLYLATVAEKAYVQPNGDIELNGLAIEEAFLKGLFTKLEVQPLIFRVGRFKSAIEPLILDRMSPENKEQLVTLIADIWGDVRTALSAKAKVPSEKVDEWVSELSIQSIDDAKKAGLITETLFSDEFDDLVHEAAKWGESDEPKYVSVSEMYAATKSRGKEKRKIALLVAEGEIVKGESTRGQVGDDTYLSALAEIKDDDDVAAVVVRINSPGGDALASDVLWRELAVLDEDRPVVASMGDIAASGGYYMAAGARHILAEPTTITGSIGVFGVLFNAESLFKNKLGVQFDRVATHPYADFGNFTRPLAKKESDAIQAGVERTYRRFINVVAESRGFEKVEDVEKIAEGRVWSGRRAVELGLVDELGGLDRALAKAAEFSGLTDGYQIDVYPKTTDRLSRLLEQLSEDSVSLGHLEAKMGLSSSVVRFLSKMASGPLEHVLSLMERVRDSRRPGVLAREPVSATAIR
ncbi:MAG: signal peptide peptidase SppA [Bdellovibrionaceae bacterium]|nr:signal peptide peptidase SppA [Pseudobdellovibrionaceae bacterium]